MNINQRTTTPRPPRRNPFKPKGLQARQYDAMLQAYAIGHRDIIRGTVRCTGNGWASPFWKGYDGHPPYLAPKDSLAYACYRAGQNQRLADDARGVYIAPSPMHQGRRVK